MMSTVIGGAMLPHAPQFFTMPDTEDKKNVEHVREVAADVGKKLRALQPALWIKTVVLASGGMSHFPGTDRYSNPELDWDTRALEKLKSGNLKSLIGYDETELDDTGNIELRCWACAAGALGERKPDIVSMDPSWHHNYASLAWTGGHGEAHRAAHYPSIKPELVELTSALHFPSHDAERRAQ